MKWKKMNEWKLEILSLFSLVPAELGVIPPGVVQEYRFGRGIAFLQVLGKNLTP